MHNINLLWGNPCFFLKSHFSKGRKMSFFETTYGEIVDLAFLYGTIQNHCPATSTQNYHFYDLGSGYGKIIHHMHDKFNYCCGIEIVKERHEIAVNNYDYDNVDFFHGNFFDFTFSTPCVVFTNNMCFGTGSNKRLSQKILRELTKNDIIISSKKFPLLEKYFQKEYTLDCSWGPSEIFIYVL